MKIHLITLGCPKNVVDSEYLKGSLEQDTISFIQHPHEADVIIINTCSFLLSAREEAIETILEAIQLKRKGKCRYIFVVGCLPQKYRHELEKELPEVDGFFEQYNFQEIARLIARQIGTFAYKERRRAFETPGHYDYLKIAEGCDNNCSYCTIPSIKGNFRSKDFTTLLNEAQCLSENGVRELIVIAQDTTYYGKDLDNGVSLSSLLRRLTDIDRLKWIRLLYAHPAHIDDELIDLLNHDKVCRYIDLPIQHISDTILKKMRRKVTGDQIKKLIEKLRSRVPNIAIRTTVMVGFPGETEHDFKELIQFISDTRFERLGVFKYSREEGTRSALLARQIDEELKEYRYQQIMELQQDIAYEHNNALINRELEVIVDEFNTEEQCYIARTEWDSPLIDNRVLINSPVSVGAFVRVKINDALEYDLKGTVISF